MCSVSLRRVWTAVALACLAAGPASAKDLKWKVQEIDTNLGVGYAVRILDMNGDKKPDIVVVDTKRLVWYENPTWKPHAFLEGATSPDNVCFAPHDVNGDGQVDFAVGSDWKPFNTRSGGILQWATQGKDGKWQTALIDPEIPTLHRIQWHDMTGDGKPELVAVPLMGRNTTREGNWSEQPLEILAYSIPANPSKDRWPKQVVNKDLHVAHNFTFADLDGDKQDELLVASYEGVTQLTRGKDGKWQPKRIGAGNQQTNPSRGASEIKVGKLAAGPYIATIEPWHGNQVVVYTPPTAAGELWQRHVLDEQLKWGHAISCVNLDGDADEELVIGVRDDLNATWSCGVRIFDPVDAAAGKWDRQIVDAGGVAVEDAAAGDLDGDGRADVVAVGRKTQNVRIYWNQGK